MDDDSTYENVTIMVPPRPPRSIPPSNPPLPSRTPLNTSNHQPLPSHPPPVSSNPPPSLSSPPLLQSNGPPLPSNLPPPDSPPTYAAPPTPAPRTVAPRQVGVSSTAARKSSSPAVMSNLYSPPPRIIPRGGGQAPVPSAPLPVRPSGPALYSSQTDLGAGVGVGAGDGAGAGAGTVAGAAGLARLEQGVVVTVFSLKKKPERMHLVASQDLCFVQCVRSLKDKPEICVDASHVQEIRAGRRCTDFEKWSEEANKTKNELCLVLFYGIEAMPQSLAIAARNPEEFSYLHDGLTHLLETVRSQTHQTQRQRWFRRQFHECLNLKSERKANDWQDRVSANQLRQWLLKNGFKANIKRDINPVINELCLTEPFKYGAFRVAVREIMAAHSVRLMLKAYTLPKDGLLTATTGTLLKFLWQEQCESQATEAEAQGIMDQHMEGKEILLPGDATMTLVEFEDFLFSPLNSVWNPEHNTIHQDMTQPLTDYWISSSHNTYLVGHQFYGLSSEEMYARCLRMGCRCLELDCWDGSDGEPIITHGRTLVSKIKLADVLKIIKENAWVTSEYPIILSIENHLSLRQQRYMASLMQDIFKEELLTEPIDPLETEMPSPEQLKRKIIIKDRKLKSDIGTTDTDEGLGQKCTSKNGVLKMQDPDDQNWYPFTFGLTDSSIFFTNDKGDEDDDDAEEDIDYDDYFCDADSDEDEDDLNYQPWYYADLARREVKRLLRGENKNEQSCVKKLRDGAEQSCVKKRRDGAFLVRKSEAGQNAGADNSYTLSFVWEGEVKHVRVRTKEENGRTLYTFGNEVWRPSIVELIKYFRHHRLYIANENTHVYLDKPVCPPHQHIDEEWFRPEINRWNAEHMLLRIPQEGVFLVRGSSEPGCLSLSFRHKKKISHFHIVKRGNAYAMGSYRFVSLPKMIEYFRRRPLYRKTKLTVAAHESMATYTGDVDCGIYDTDIYHDPTEVETWATVSVRALYDFMGQETENEMSFTRGAIITNVREEDKPWWKGDYMDQKQKAFPASYVQVIAEKSEKSQKQSENELTRGKEDTLELKNIRIDNGPYLENKNVHTLYCFRIEHPRYDSPLQFGCESLLQLEEWVTAIRDRQQRFESWDKDQQKQEKILKRAREFSDLIVYCQSVNYDPSGTSRHYHISSLSEDKVQTNDPSLLNASRMQFLRVYPKGKRVDSSNYDPVSRWACGIQLTALNYQTPDLPMQLNQARFLSNGGCGYVLKPQFMRDFNYTLFDILNHKVPSECLFLSVNVLAGRNLCPVGRVTGLVRPFVVVEVIGLDLDCAKQRTKPVEEDNGLKPQWNEEVKKFDVSCPELAFLRFEVLSETDSKVISQATFPVTGLRQGYRSVPLKNVFSENLEMSSLLVHIEIKSPKDAEEENLFRMIEASRKYRAELLQESDSNPSAHNIGNELLKTEMNILKYLQSKRGAHPASRNGR